MVGGDGADLEPIGLEDCGGGLGQVARQVGGGDGLGGVEPGLVGEGAALAEEELDPARDAGVFAAGGGAEDAEGVGAAVGDAAGLEEGGQVGGVVDVEVGEEDDVEVIEREAQLAGAGEGAAAGIDEDARLAVEQQDVGGGGAAGGAGSAGAQGDGLEGRFLRRGGAPRKTTGRPRAEGKGCGGRSCVSIRPAQGGARGRCRGWGRL